MDAPEKPKNKRNLLNLGSLLLFGGIGTYYSAGRSAIYYEEMGVESGTSWAAIISCIMMGSGFLVLLAGFFGTSGNDE